MTRMHFETENDLQNQAKLAKKICRTFGCQIEKLPEQYRLDYVCVRGINKNICAWLEIKCRNNSSTAFPTYMLSLNKWISGKKYYNETRVPFILAIRFTDRDLILQYDESFDNLVQYRFQGRTVQRRDIQDVEPCVFIGMDLFDDLDNYD